MTPSEVAITAALGASFLTAFGSLGVVWVQESRRRKASDLAALRAAVTELLARSLAVAMRARALGEAMKVRSGLKEGVDVTMRNRKPVDPLEVHDWMAQEVIPLNSALAELWTRDDQEGIRLANDVVNKCAELLGVSTARQPASDGLGRVRRMVAGERWTPEMIAETERAVRELAQARKKFAEHARIRLGEAAVELFTFPQAEDKSMSTSESLEIGPAPVNG